MAPPRSPLAPKDFPAIPAIAGVRLAAMAAGIRYRGRPDLALVELAPGSAVARQVAAGGMSPSRVPSGALSRSGPSPPSVTPLPPTTRPTCTRGSAVAGPSGGVTGAGGAQPASSTRHPATRRVRRRSAAVVAKLELDAEILTSQVAHHRLQLVA